MFNFILRSFLFYTHFAQKMYQIDNEEQMRVKRYFNFNFVNLFCGKRGKIPRKKKTKLKYFSNSSMLP